MARGFNRGYGGSRGGSNNRGSSYRSSNYSNSRMQSSGGRTSDRSGRYNSNSNSDGRYDSRRDRFNNSGSSRHDSGHKRSYRVSNYNFATTWFHDLYLLSGIHVEWTISTNCIGLWRFVQRWDIKLDYIIFTKNGTSPLKTEVHSNLYRYYLYFWLPSIVRNYSKSWSVNMEVNKFMLSNLKNQMCYEFDSATD